MANENAELLAELKALRAKVEAMEKAAPPVVVAPSRPKVSGPHIVEKRHYRLGHTYEPGDVVVLKDEVASSWMKPVKK